MIYLKKHATEQGVIIAMCDATLIDKVLKEGAIELNIKDYSSFYKGELLSAEKAKVQINANEVFSANVVGEESVAVAIGSTIIEKENINTVKKVPYAQAFRVKV